MQIELKHVNVMEANTVNMNKVTVEQGADQRGLQRLLDGLEETVESLMDALTQ